MNCDKGDRPATVHLTEIGKDGQKITRNLCEFHAIEEGIMVKIGGDITSDIPINELLVKYVLKHATIEEIPQQTLECEQCGMTYNEFRKHGFLGCPNCYTAFEELLLPVLEQVHGDVVQHIGKIPSRSVG